MKTTLAVCEDLVGNTELSPESNPKEFLSEPCGKAASRKGAFREQNLKD